MTKAEVKALCEDDDKLQWWAMVLFAEICEMYQGVHNNSDGHMEPVDHKIIAQYVRAKSDEFPRLVIQRQIEKAKANAEAKEGA